MLSLYFEKRSTKNDDYNPQVVSAVYFKEVANFLV